MHEHLFVALTQSELLANPKEASQTCLKCFKYAAQTNRTSAFKAIQMIVKRQTKLRFTSAEILNNPEI